MATRTAIPRGGRMYSAGLNGNLVFYTGDTNRGIDVFVDSVNGDDANNDGLSWEQPLATIDAAVAKCTASRGDVIYVGAGHSETLTTAITLDVAGVSVVGMGRGTNRPQLTVGGTIDGITITAANCAVVNIYFNESTAAATANINIAAVHALVQDCHFDLGATDLECITITADGDNFTIQGNTFLITANGPDAAIEIEAAGADVGLIEDNLFLGGSSTNVWDASAVNSTVAHTSVLTRNNYFRYGTAFNDLTTITSDAYGNVFAYGARPATGVSIDIYASTTTTVSAGTADEPTTIVDAINLAAAGDRVLLYPGTYTVTAALAADVANLTIRPVHYVPGQRAAGVEIANDTDDVNTIDVTAAGVTIEGIHFTKGAANTTDGTELIDVASDRFTLRDSIIDLEARTNADGVNLATGTKGHLIERNLFTDGANAKSYIASAASASEIRDNHFDCSAADLLCFEQLATPGDGVAIHHNTMVSDGADGALMSWQTSPGKNAVYLNYVLGSSDTDVFGDDADNDLYVLDNYRAGAATGAGTVINPSVT